MLSLILFLFPTVIVRLFVNLFNIKRIQINKDARIGFSWISARRIELDENTRIGHFNLIKVDSLVVKKRAYIKHLNFIKGDFSLILGSDSWINHSNKISTIGHSYHPVKLELLSHAKIGVSHLLDMTDSIRIGEYSMLAGSDTQIWTHSFYYSKETAKIARIDAPVLIGSHCYIGSRCCITSGVTIGDAITVGAQTCVSKSIDKQGLYVSQPMRYIEFDPDNKINNLGEPIYSSYVYRKQ